MSYQGGKQKIGKKIYKVIDAIEEYFEGEDLLDYMEPFVGFCGVIKHFGAEDTDRKLFGYDLNKDIIKMWKSTQNGWKPPTKCTKKRYEELKNSKKVSAERGFIGVACSYSGIFFVGYRGTQTFKQQNKTKTVNSAAMTARSVNKIAKMVENVKFKVSNYINLKPDNMLIYCDPPYKSNDYGQSDFFHFNTELFWDIMRDWSKYNIVIISEYTAPKDFKCVWKNELNVIHHGKTNKKIEKLFIHNTLYKNIDNKTKKYIRNIN